MHTLRHWRRYLGAFAAFFLAPPAMLPAHAEEATAPLYRIVVEWAGPDDVDLFTSDPDRKVAWYHWPKQATMELVRDSRGYLPSGADLPPVPNREETIIRGGTAGLYAASVFLFDNRSKKAVSVSVRLEKIGPPAEILHEGALDLRHRGDERTLVAFKLDESGRLSDLNTRPISVVQMARTSYLHGRTDSGLCPLNWNPQVPCWAQEQGNQ